jgi:hypothetical protein
VSGEAITLRPDPNAPEKKNWPRASVTLKLPMWKTGAAPVRTGIEKDKGEEIGHVSGSSTPPGGAEVTLWFALDPALCTPAMARLVEAAKKMVKAGKMPTRVEREVEVARAWRELRDLVGDEQ